MPELINIALPDEPEKSGVKESAIVYVLSFDDYSISKAIHATVDYALRDVVSLDRKRRNTMDKSCVQVYTGHGKGKTTAAMGLAMRAAGQGLSVKIVQFMKGRDTGELASLQRLGIDVLRASRSEKFFHTMTEDEKAVLRTDALAVLRRIEAWLDSIDLLILDEALGALSCGVVKPDELLHIMDARGGTEVVITGRNAPDEIVKKADLVTEMREVKHYMQRGIAARKGIEY